MTSDDTVIVGLPSMEAHRMVSIRQWDLDGSISRAIRKVRGYAKMRLSAPLTCLAQMMPVSESGQSELFLVAGLGG